LILKQNIYSIIKTKTKQQQQKCKRKQKTKKQHHHPKKKQSKITIKKLLYLPVRAQFNNLSTCVTTASPWLVGAREYPPVAGGL
jgi:hypothetical protein